MAIVCVDGNSLCCELLQMVCDPILKLSATLEKNDSEKILVGRNNSQFSVGACTEMRSDDLAMFSRELA